MAVGTHLPEQCEPGNSDIGGPPRFGLFSLPGVALLAMCSRATAQEIAGPVTLSSDTRSSSVYFGIGFLEILVVGYGYQIDDQFAIGCKANLAAPPQVGLGFKGSYFFSSNLKLQNELALFVDRYSFDCSRRQIMLAITHTVAVLRRDQNITLPRSF